MFVKPVTLQCGHTFCQHCALTVFLKSQLTCGVCRSEDIYEHPFDLKVNINLDSISK